MLKFVTLEGILSCNNSPKIGANQKTAVWTFTLLGLAAYIFCAYVDPLSALAG